MPFLSFLSENARRAPEAPALVERNYLRGDGRPYRAVLTHGQLQAVTCGIGGALGRLAEKGGHVALLMDNCLELLPAFFGILASGSVAVMLNTHCPVQELVQQLARADSAFLIYGAQNASLARQILELSPTLHSAYVLPSSEKAGADRNLVGCNLLALAKETEANQTDVPEFSDDTLAVIYFSSGSTGEKKAILLDHGSLRFSSQTERSAHGQTAADTFLCIPPFYHAGALAHTLGGLCVGAKTVLLRGIQPNMILDTIANEKCTIAWMPVPCAVDILDQLQQDRERPDTSSLRLVHMGAQPIPQALVQRWKSQFPRVAFEITYGLTEAGGPNVLHSGTDGRTPAGAVGKPGDGWSCRIVDAQGRPQPDGRAGELVIRGRGVMRGYYKDPAATAGVLSPEGWLHTGDIARRDGTGCYYILDRRKNVIIRGGENLYPAEIEAFLQGLPGIAEVTVVAMPERRLGEVPVCVVRPKEGFPCTEGAMLAAFQVLPRSWRPVRCFLCDIPHLPSGKPDRQQLLQFLRKIWQSPQAL